MGVKTKGVAAAIVLAGGIYLGTSVIQSPSSGGVPTYVDEAAVISALRSEGQLVGLTGSVAKTVAYHADKWYGDKTYSLTARGTFKLGVNTDDIEVVTRGNTVTVRFPRPEIIAVSLPFDKAKISKDVGVFRKDLSEAELQELYGKARTGAEADIERNRQAFEQAGESIGEIIERLVEPIDGVEHVKIEEAI